MRRLLLLVLPLFVNAANGQQSYLVDWDVVGREAIDHLVELVKIPSVNPPGNETEVAGYIKAVLAAEGVESELYALDPARANLVARHEGNGSKRPILIMGHTDVVGVQTEKWYADPFSGIREDGYIYGRGTLDDKDNVAAGMMVMILLKRLGVPLDLGDWDRLGRGLGKVTSLALKTPGFLKKPMIRCRFSRLQTARTPIF